MKLSTILRSERAAWILGAVVVGILSAGAYWLVGWLGIGLIGLIGLTVSNRVDLQSGHGVIDSGFGGDSVRLYAKQLAAQAHGTSPEQKMAAAAEHDQRSRTLYRINTAFIALTVLAFGFFVLHQLP